MLPFIINIFYLHYSQSQAEIKSQAESKLNTMTPDQIDAKLQQLGMSRADAEAKANAYGINLESYSQ